MSLTKLLRSTAVRFILLAATFVFISYALNQQWTEVRSAAQSIELQWGYILAASAVVLCTYAALIQSWRMLLAGWGGTLSYPTATRIWAISKLGLYLPGKVWSMGALGLLASREGVSGVAAAGAAVLGTLLNIGAGVAIAVIAGAQGVEAVYPALRTVAIIGAGAFVIGVALLPAVLPWVLDRFARWRGLPVSQHHLTKWTVWSAAAINAASWVGYGVAFALFAKGVTPRITAEPITFVAAFASSYVAGYLVLFSPGGFGVRELALSGFLVSLGVAGQGDAVILGATSRVWLTVLEVVPGVIGLFLMTPAQRAGLRRGA